jgi:putative tryptophan/tyrosine transport system substrate-binding protein
MTNCCRFDTIPIQWTERDRILASCVEKAKKMKRRISIVIAGLVVLGSMSVLVARKNGGADDRAPVVIVNFIRHPLFDEVVKGIREGLEAAVEEVGRVRVIELRANGEIDKLAMLANEALALQPSVVVPISTAVTLAVTKACPPHQRVVFSFVANPSDVGMDTKPENMTGVSDRVNFQANLKLIRQLFPTANRVGMIHNPGEPNSRYGVEKTRLAATIEGLSLVLVPISRPSEVLDAVRALEGRADVIYVGSDNAVVSAMPGLTAVATGLKIPVIASERASVAEGALASISVDYVRVGRVTGDLVAQLLRNPNLQAGKLGSVLIEGNALILNLAAARTLNIDFPPELRASASSVIDPEAR